MQRINSYSPAGSVDATPANTVTLAHDARHLRRKLLHLADGSMAMLDLKEAVLFADGDMLLTDGGSYIRIVAEQEDLYEVTARNTLHLMEIAWHLGNRHLPAQIDEDRILIGRDHVIRAMLEGLGANVREVCEAFQPVRGAYHAHGGHGHGGHAHHAHD
ncbi:urease accessory protein UreE [Rhizobium sp. PAMB 3174]